jgi:glutamate N-acetyltransferase/amino-acid N-acetyltransferase
MRSKARNTTAEWAKGRLHGVPGFRTAALHCGLKTKAGRPDLALLVCDKLAAAAGVFTTNRVCAAPVRYSRGALALTHGHARAVIVNAGNANACTGAQGARDAREMASLTAKAIGAQTPEILVCSTGIIGQPMPMQKLRNAVPLLARHVRKRSAHGDFARAIMTTDLVPKTAACTTRMFGRPVRVAGACKGSGMIAPRMATMLGFLATDASVTPRVLQQALDDVVEETFNCVTVDGDTSTNDTVLALASGAAGRKRLTKTSGQDYEALCAGLHHVCDSLARQIAADGEGAKHLVTVFVGGARNARQAKVIARTIAESPLVKTAIAGNDPNWGRIVCAAGRSGIRIEPKDCALTVCGHDLFKAGQPLPFRERKVSQAMKGKEVSIVLMVGDGPGAARFYTCDLTHGYITINADYHT